eukprot:9849844-Ditylum_brightwellii.AAC.1
MERRKRNDHINCNKDIDVDDGGDDVADCRRTDRNKLTEHVICNEADDVDNGSNDGVDDGDDDGADGVDKHFVQLLQVAGCCRTDRHKQNEHLVCNEDNNLDD